MKPRDIDTYAMQAALACAKQSLKEGEVPIGAVLVINQQIVAKGHNQTITQCDPTAHAEILVLRQAAALVHNYRLLEATLYVTLEPCLMCVGAMIQARIKRLVFAAYDKQVSIGVGVANIMRAKGINHRFSVSDGFLADESAKMLKAFFLQRRSESN